MSRSTARDCLAPGTAVAPGEVLVATEIGDPARGLLPCPAAPLLGGTLHRRGMRVRYAPVPQCAEASQADEGAALFVTTSLWQDGTATAIGAAADPVDGLAVAVARGAVEEWSSIVGTRRLLGAVSPWCPGAAAALERTRQAVAAAAGTVYVCGWLAATAEDCADLEKEGAVFTSSLQAVPDGATVLIPAHGASPAVHAEAAERGLDIIDATCPLAGSVQAAAARFTSRGDQVVIIGQPGHAVVPGILGQAPGRVTVVQSPAGAVGAGAPDPRRVSYVLQPGIPVEDTMPIAVALRSRYPALHDPHPDTFCYAASDRAETVRTVAASSDMVLVLGPEADPDTRSLVGLARACRAKAHAVADTSEIEPGWLAGTAAIGLAESTSARRGLAAEVAHALSGLGPLSRTVRQVTTELMAQDQREPAPAGPDTGRS